MKEGLNLLPSMAKFQAARIKLKKRINLAMGVLLGAWVLFAGVVFGLLAYNNYLLNKAENDNATALNKYKTLVNNVVLSKKNKYQAKLVGKVLNERFEYGSSIKKVSELFSDMITIDGFEIRDKKQFLLKGSLKSGSALDEIEEKIKDINNGNYSDFKSAKLSNILVGRNGWTFEMEVNL